MEIKAHQNPFPDPRQNERGNSSGLYFVSWGEKIPYSFREPQKNKDIGETIKIVPLIHIL